MTNFNIIIDNNIISKLLGSFTDHTINNEFYKYLGKGGDGVVYLFGKYVVKIYAKIIINYILKEFYVVGLLQELDAINKNIIHVYKYYLSLNNPVIIMEYMKGDLTEWCDDMVVNKYNLSKNELDLTWMSMIFQVTYGIMFINRLGILHSDATPKNILYNTSTSEKNSAKIYKVNNTGFRIPFNYVFKIADFGRIQILGSTLNEETTEEIKVKLKSRNDLYGLSRVLHRVLVNYGRNDYNWNKINSMVNSSEKFKQYKNESYEKLKNQCAHLSQQTKNILLLRSLIYYAIENDVIDKNEIIEKYSLVWPSDNVLNTLDGLTNSNIENVFDLFDVFKVHE